jgi:hypothetical protein
MSTLLEILGAPAIRPQVIADCQRLIDEEVASKGGLSGLPVKAGYGVVKAVKPGFVPDVVDHMLDDFCRKLEPIYQAARAKNEPISAHFNGRPGDVAEALLSITDERAQRSKNGTLKALYEKLRPTGKKHVELAVPRLSRLIDKHTKTAAAPVTGAPASV